MNLKERIDFYSKKRDEVSADVHSYTTSSGERFKRDFAPQLDKDGKISFSVKGKVDLKALHNADRASCDFNFIINQMRANNASGYELDPSYYGDFTQMPKSYHEALNLAIKSESAFDSLPIDIKSKFNNSRNYWFSTIGSPEWYSKMGLLKSSAAASSSEAAVKPVESSVKEGA